MKTSLKEPIKTHSIPKTVAGPSFDAVIFDIDNVLIDTHQSYLDAIRWTVEIFLTAGRVPFFIPAHKSGNPDLLSPQDVHRFKLLGGFNDDWDCCYGLLTYLLGLKVKKRTLTNLKSSMNLESFSKKVKHHPLGVNGIVKLLGPSGFVTIEKIARIFQEVYLGKDLFKQTEGLKAAFWKKAGLIHKEKLIFKPALLAKLKECGIKLGIATGRPRFEALYALKHFGILDFFDAVTTIDEVKAAEKEMKSSLRKPHPYSLVETAKRMGLKKRFIYVGDLPDDVLAAHAARRQSILVQPVAFFPPSSNSLTLKELQKSNPAFILRKPAEVVSLAISGKIKN